MQVVNGYLCMNCCDVDKARLGQDPHQSANQVQKQLQKVIEHELDPLAPDNFGPAVTFGGSLPSSTVAGGAATTAPAAAPSQDSSSANSKVDTSAIDLLA